MKKYNINMSPNCRKCKSEFFFRCEKFYVLCKMNLNSNLYRTEKQNNNIIYGQALVLIKVPFRFLSEFCLFLNISRPLQVSFSKYINGRIFMFLAVVHTDNSKYQPVLSCILFILFKYS